MRRGPLLAWLARIAPEVMAFDRWLTTVLSLPDEPERTCDTSAAVRRLDQGGFPWAIVAEFQSDPDAEMFGRMLEYLGRLWRVERPTRLPGDRFNLLGVVVNLIGGGTASRSMVWSPQAHTTLHVCQWNMASENASALLDSVTANQVPRAALVFAPLMQRGGESGIIERWLELANAETDAELKANLGAAVTPAELVDANRKDVWATALEGFNVQESTVINGWMTAGMARLIVGILQERFGPVPEVVRTRLTQTQSDEQLRHWAMPASSIGTLAEFQRALGV